MKIVKTEIVYVLIVAVILTVVLASWYFFTPVANWRCGPCGCYGDECGSSSCSCSSWTNGNCQADGCAPGQRLKTRTCSPSVCDKTSNCVDDSSCKCSDGTPFMQCSVTKPLYCSFSFGLINGCTLCGCLSGQTCNPTSLACYSSTCSNFGGTCNSSANCQALNGFHCNSDPFDCSGSTPCCCAKCVCSDGTACDKCTSDRRFCDNGNLVYNCDRCPCSAGQVCLPVSGGTGNSKCCTIQCSGKNCGPDGCGGICGTCAIPQTCSNGVCTA